MELSMELDEFAGRSFFLAIRGEPDLTDPAEFGVTVYYTDPRSDEHVPVARIDTDHGRTHLDKLFLEGEPKEWMDCTLWEAVEHLSRMHPEYARQYLETHRR